MYDERKLRAKIAYCMLTNADVAVYLGISRASFYRKLTGKTEFRRSEISKLMELLQLDRDEMLEIFFAIAVT